MIHETFLSSVVSIGPRNKLTTINFPEKVVSPPHNSSFWGQWLYLLWQRGSLTKGKTELTLIKHQCYQETPRHESWSILALWQLGDISCIYIFFFQLLPTCVYVSTTHLHPNSSTTNILEIIQFKWFDFLNLHSLSGSLSYAT